MIKKILSYSFVAFLVVFAALPVFAESGRDLIIALDTSLSMAGHGGDDIIGRVKNSLENSFIDKLKEGDSLTFITFDSEVTVYETIVIKDPDSQQDTIKKFIRPIKADGKWTYTRAMFKAVFDKASEMQQADPDRKQIIIIMTDAMDDPPPSEKSKKLDIKELAAGIEGGEDLDSSEWFVYFLSFAKLQESGKFDSLRQSLKENISENTAVVDGQDNVEAAVESIDEGLQKLEEEEKRRNAVPVWVKLLIAAAVALLVLAVIFYFYTVSKIKVRGALVFKNLDKITPEEEKVSLSNYDSRVITIGNTPSFNLYLMEFTDNRPLVLEAVKYKGNLKVQVNDDKGLQADFADDKKDIFLSDGDSFRVSNYQFTYLEEE